MIVLLSVSISESSDSCLAPVNFNLCESRDLCCHQELEEFEERTREETQKLVTMVTELQSENRRMQERREAERNGDAAGQTGTEYLSVSLCPHVDTVDKTGVRG